MAAKVLSTSRMQHVRPLERGLSLRVDFSHVLGPARRGNWPVPDVARRVDVSRMQKGVAVSKRARGSRLESMVVMQRSGRCPLEVLRKCGTKREIGLCPRLNSGWAVDSRGPGVCDCIPDVQLGFDSCEERSPLAWLCDVDPCDEVVRCARGADVRLVRAVDGRPPRLKVLCLRGSDVDFNGLLSVRDEPVRDGVDPRPEVLVLAEVVLRQRHRGRIQWAGGVHEDPFAVGRAAGAVSIGPGRVDGGGGDDEEKDGPPHIHLPLR